MMVKLGMSVMSAPTSTRHPSITIRVTVSQGTLPINGMLRMSYELDQMLRSWVIVAQSVEAPVLQEHVPVLSWQSTRHIPAHVRKGTEKQIRFMPITLVSSPAAAFADEGSATDLEDGLKSSFNAWQNR